MDAHIQRIIDWRENFATLPDTHFFELIRMYLGEVHTPYNKPKLIEELGAFLRKEENRRTLVSLLSERDILLLCAVHFIPCATQEKLAHFFDGTFNFANVYERLLNLEERLILYRHGDKKSGKIVISINPMLEDILQPFLKREVLLPVAEVAARAEERPLLSAELLASFVCFVLENPDLCKTDGSFKKRTATELEKKFPGRLDCLKCLADALRNLGLLKETDSGYEADLPRLGQFADLAPVVQLAYLCVSSQGRFSRTALVRQAQLLIDVCGELSAIRDESVSAGARGGLRGASVSAGAASAIRDGAVSAGARGGLRDGAAFDGADGALRGPSGLTRSVLLRLAFLASEKDNDVPGLATFAEPSRFSAILERSRQEAADSSVVNVTAAPATAVSLLDRLIDSALALGIFQTAGFDEKGEAVFCVQSDFARMIEEVKADGASGAFRGASLSAGAGGGARGSSLLSGAGSASRGSSLPSGAGSASRETSASLPKVLMIDAAFSVTLMPGLPLSKLLELVLVMDLVRYDTAASFEISRKSVMRAFDSGLTQNQLLDLLSGLCPFALPQNLLVSIEDWSRSYSSASIFKGYVLKVDADNIVYAEKNPVIAPFIAETLAPGVYLLSVQSDEQAQRLIDRSGLDFIGKIKSARKEGASLGFPQLSLSERVKAPELEDDATGGGRRPGVRDSSGKVDKADAPALRTTLSSAEERSAHFDQMRAELDKLTMSPEQKDGLLHRIQNKIILNASQLRSDSVRLEKIEAGGMDYNGKVHVIEGAISSNSIIELEYDDPKQADGVLIVMGTPLALEKMETDTFVRLRLEPSKEEAVHSVGKARFLKRIRGSVLR